MQIHGTSSLPRSWQMLALDRVRGRPAWVVLTELFIGLGWIRAAAEKLIDPAWWRGEGIERFAALNTDRTLGWYRPFLELVLDLAPLVAILVIAGQIIAGLTLSSGRSLPVGLAAGMFLNLHFMAAGAVTPSAFYLLAQGALALWLCERHARPAPARALKVSAAAGAFAVGLNLPFVSTLHPHHVIEDPAVMFCLGGSLAVLTCLLASQPTLPSMFIDSIAVE